MCRRFPWPASRRVTAKDFGRQLRWRMDRLRAGALPEIGGLEFQGDGRARTRSPFFSREPKPSPHSRHSVRSSVAKSRMSVSKVVSLEMVLAPRSGTTEAVVDAACQPP